MGHPKTTSISILLISFYLTSTLALGLGKVTEVLPTTPSSIGLGVEPTEKNQVEDHHELEKSLRDKVTSDRFLKVIRPHGENETTVVKVNTYVRDIELVQINPESYRFKVDLTLRQLWNDKRLEFEEDHKKHPEFKYFPLNEPKNIWKPDIFFREAVKADFHYVTTPNVLVWVYPNGDVLYSLRVSAELRCHKSPNSAQTTIVCPMSFASYAHTTEEIDLKWDDADDTPVQVFKERLHIPGYEFEKVTTEADHSTTKIGTFGKIVAKFHFIPEKH